MIELIIILKNVLNKKAAQKGGFNLLVNAIPL